MSADDSLPPFAIVCTQLCYTPEQAGAATGRSRTRIFKAIQDKEITARKDGKATVIEASELLRWVRAMPTIGRNPQSENPAARFLGEISVRTGSRMPAR
jgi:hypothetical protein